MRLMALIVAAIIGISVLAGCQPSALPSTPETPAGSAAVTGPRRVGIIFEGSDADENPLYRLALEGADNAATTFSVDVTPLEVLNQTDVVTEIEGFVEQDYDLLIGIGTESLYQAIESTARTNPNQLFVSVEHSIDEPNVLSIQFDMAQPSFLAGYLAAGISATGMVCTYGSPDIPGSADYLAGFANGVRYYNVQHDADVALMGWDHNAQSEALSDSYLFSGDERQLVADYFDAGCDVLFPVTHSINLGLASMAQDYELAVIGTDVDWFVVAPEFGEIWLTSVQKNIDRAMFDTIEALTQDTLIARASYLGTPGNGGVGLASFHFWEDKIPDDLKAELANITQALVDDELEP